MTPEPRSPAFGDIAVYLVGVAGLAASLTLLLLGMRSIMAIGGACAEGGPYGSRSAARRAFRCS